MKAADTQIFPESGVDIKAAEVQNRLFQHIGRSSKAAAVPVHISNLNLVYL
jgi:hypothetical protein